MKIIILTNSELRHTFLRKAIALDNRITVLKSYCEGTEKSLSTQIRASDSSSDIQKKHLSARERSEKDFFETFVKLTEDESHPEFIKKGSINDDEFVNQIKRLNPDLIVAYGCSIIKESLLEAFEGKFVNIHLGLSPYYRGSGTNFWPMVNRELDYLGVTFMHIDAGIDTGKVIHQYRARVYENDTPHQIGNRLIADIAVITRELVRSFDVLEDLEQIIIPEKCKYYKNSDFTEKSVKLLYRNFEAGMVDEYLSMKENDKVKILTNSLLDKVII